MEEDHIFAVELHPKDQNASKLRPVWVRTQLLGRRGKEHRIWAALIAIGKVNNNPVPL